MIIVTAETKIFGEERKIFRITVKGHSGYADAGHDIVCAGVSSAFEYMANVMTENFSLSCVANINPKAVIAELRLDELDERDSYIASGLMNGFMAHVTNMENHFGDYIIVITKDL